MSGAFCKLGIAKVPKADVRVSVKAEAAPLSKDATNNFTSARLSVLSSFPRNPALPSVIPQVARVSVLITIQGKTGNIQFLAILPD